jgi:hydrogenase maturation protease
VTEESKNRILLLALGNDLLGDDAVGLAAARMVASEFPEAVEILEANASGFELLELICGYSEALIIDATHTGIAPAGTVFALSLEELLGTQACSPHYAGLSDAARLAKRLDLDFPETVYVLAMEIDQPRDLHMGLSERVQNALPQFVDRIWQILDRWRVPVSPL